MLEAMNGLHAARWRMVPCLLAMILLPVPLVSQTEEEVHVDLVEVFVAATHHNQEPAVDLNAEDFAIQVDGKPVEITHFSRLLDPDSDVPVNIAFLVDTSGSMGAGIGLWPIDLARESALAILNELHQNDTVQVFSFDVNLRILTKSTTDREVVKNALTHVSVESRSNRGTGLYYALDSMAKQMGSYPGRKFLFLFSDGLDTMSGPSPESILTAFKQRNISFVASGARLGPRITAAPSAPGFGGRETGEKTPSFETLEMRHYGQSLRFLRSLVEATGGLTLERVTDGKELGTALASMLRSQYVLGFYSETSTSGKWHDIRVTTRAKGVVLRCRAGYFD